MTKPCGCSADIPLLVETWRLVSVETRAEDGEIRETYGANPLGILIYDPMGRMSVHLMGRDRR